MRRSKTPVPQWWNGRRGRLKIEKIPISCLIMQ
jgi:hypothetical protein